MDIINFLTDERSECVSVLTVMNLEEYKSLAYESFNNSGNIDGQRDVIKKSSVATKIKMRMNADFLAGAIFPPVVLGLCLDDSKMEKVRNRDFSKEDINPKTISIIDGMQRSYIYFENYDECKDRTLRVEFWITSKSVKLLYRMLVLNTGQVPWNTRRQIEVVFGNLSDTITKAIFNKKPEWEKNVELMGVDENRRRTQAGKFQTSTMIQMYLGFNTRNVKVDVSEELASEYQRFDMIESIDQDENFDLFINCIIHLITLDFEFSKCTEKSENGQFTEGKDIFSSTPACLGFVVACAEYVLGKAPVDRKSEKKTEQDNKLSEKIKAIADFLSVKSNPLALDTLNSVISGLSKSRIGDEMRRLFKNAFGEMLKYEDLNELDSLEAFWREQ